MGMFDLIIEMLISNLFWLKFYIYAKWLDNRPCIFNISAEKENCLLLILLLHLMICFQEEPIEDISDAPFTPDVDMSKPWIMVDTEAPSLAVTAAKKLSKALANIPAEIKEKMGFKLTDMLQECTWNGRLCSSK